MKVLFKSLAAGLVFQMTLQTSPAASFSLVGPLNQARDAHTATLLNNGFVLVTGGGATNFYPSIMPTNTVELYDPAARTWTFGPPMTDTREYHTAVLLPNGQVLVAGGYSANFLTMYLTSAEVYDPVANSWSPAGNMSTPREGHTATLLTNGLVLVAGGAAGGAVSSAELYNPGTGTWKNTGSFSGPRAAHTATLLQNGLVLIAGGNNAAGIATAQIYNSATGTWTNTGSMKTARSSHTATLLANGKVLAAGGFSANALASAELYDPVLGTWTNTGPLHFARSGHAAVLLTNGMVLVAGGGESAYPSAGELYDPASGTWILTSSITVPRANVTATLMMNSQVLVAGGFTRITTNTFVFSTVYSTAEVYDTTASVFTLSGPQLLPEGSFQFAFTNNPGQSFSVLASSDPSVPRANWPVIGATTEISPGQYQFTDLQATNHLQQFYRVRSP